MTDRTNSLDKEGQDKSNEINESDSKDARLAFQGTLIRLSNLKKGPRSTNDNDQEFEMKMSPLKRVSYHSYWL